jgi:Ca2+-binding RTX toxin-like protein
MPNTTTNVDTISDFTAGTDKLVMDDAIFSSLSTEIASAGMFHSGAGVTTAADANNYLIYNTSTGALYYDADGASAGSAPVQFAMLTGNPVISAADFVVS